MGKQARFARKGLLATWLHSTFWEDAVHVELLDWTLYEMKTCFYRKHLELLPKRFHIVDLKRWLADSLDCYDYLTWKDKCFTGPPEAARTCEKTDSQHKCIRRISARYCPTKNLERRAARAVERIGQADGPGPGCVYDIPPQHFQCWTCIEFLQAVTKSIEGLTLVPAYLFTCVDCGGDKEPVNLGHGDSSAMFDEVVEAVASDAFDASRRRVEHKTECVGVAIQRSGHHHAWLCVKRGEPMPPEKVQNARGIHVLLDEETASVLEYSAQTAISRVGKQILRRKRGVSMGSPLSPARSGLVCRREERRFLRGDTWAAWGTPHLRHLGIPLHKLRFLVRIADDDCAGSSLHCGTCLSRLGRQVFTKRRWFTRATSLDQRSR